MRGRRTAGAASLGRARGFALLLAARVARLTVVRHRLVRRDGLYITTLSLHSQRSAPYHTPHINAGNNVGVKLKRVRAKPLRNRIFNSIIDKPLVMVS